MAKCDIMNYDTTHQECYLLDKKVTDDGMTFKEHQLKINDHRQQKYYDYYIERVDIR